jgi:polysaccharide biosynthesis/export protein
MRDKAQSMKLLATFFALFLVGNLAIAKAQKVPAPPVAAIASANPPTADQGPHPQLDQRNPRYIIQRQDVLLLTFPLSTELNQTVTVQPDGYINLQNAGSVHAQGLTVPELIVAIKNAYVGILHDPIVSVDLEDFQKPLYTVSGQVGKPGQYELRADITVAEALAVAGGMAPTAKTQVFLFHRTSNDWVQVKKIDVKDILKGKNANEDPSVQPGDMIYVPEKFITNFRKYVPYSANLGTYISQSGAF